MTSREQQIAVQILRHLHSADGGLVGELRLHEIVAPRVDPPATLAEFDTTLADLDARRLVLGVTGKLTKARKFAITDAGEAALVELTDSLTH